MPEHKAMLAVDVIGSASNERRHLGALPEIFEGVADAALREAEVPDADSGRFTGDGFLRAFPIRFLPPLVDSVVTMGRLLAERNHWQKPEVRLRVAIHCGPLPEEHGYYRPNIDLSRLLDAPAFKQVAQRCREEVLKDAFTTALILSDQAYRSVFSADLTSAVQQHEFADMKIEMREFSDRAWVRVAGVDAGRIAEFATEPVSQSAPPMPEFQAPQRSIANGGSAHGHQVTGDNNQIYGARTTNVTNIAGHNNTGIQTGSLHGDIHIGRGPR